MQRAAQAYGNVAKQTSTPRELEASLLLKAAAHFQAISEGWERGKAEIRQNVANLGLFVLNQTVAVTSDPKPEGLGSLININREIAAGLLGRA